MTKNLMPDRVFVHVDPNPRQSYVIDAATGEKLPGVKQILVDASINNSKVTVVLDRVSIEFETSKAEYQVDRETLELLADRAGYMLRPKWPDLSDWWNSRAYYLQLGALEPPRRWEAVLDAIRPGIDNDFRLGVLRKNAGRPEIPPDTPPGLRIHLASDVDGLRGLDLDALWIHGAPPEDMLSALQEGTMRFRCRPNGIHTKIILTGSLLYPTPIHHTMIACA